METKAFLINETTAKISHFAGQLLIFVKSFLHDDQKVRFSIQIGFLVLVLWIGYEFYGFVKYHESFGAAKYFERPPGVEGFLPISALISLKYWILTGVFNLVHPSGLVIFLIIFALGLLLKKSFCSWICPVGLISEGLWQFGNKLFKGNLSMPKWLDYPLRSIKYFLLIFFLYAVLWTMDVDMLSKFIYSPYNKVADIKMMYFFTNISEFALWTIGILILFSVEIKNFWCRYLCPYGALLGFLSVFSPVKVTRNSETCIDCKKCTQACPNTITIHDKKRIWSDECTACALCISACLVKNTLNFKFTKKSRVVVPVWIFGLMVILFFTLGTTVARINGKWQNNINDAEYSRRIPEVNKPIYNHVSGTVPEHKPED